MAKISFNLSTQKLDTGGIPGRLSAPGLSSGRRAISAPQLQARQQAAATVPIPFGENKPLLSQEAASTGMNVLQHAALDFQKRKDRTYAEDAALRASTAVMDLLSGQPQKEGELPGYTLLQGKTAVDARDEYQQKIVGAIDDYGRNLTGNARMMYLAAMQETKVSALNKLASHTAKQQQVFEEQVRYGRVQKFKEDFMRDPDFAMNGGSFNRALANFYTLDEQDKARKEMFGFALDTILQQDPVVGAKQAAQFYNNYEQAMDADTRLAAQKKVNTALEAAREIAKKGRDEEIEEARGKALSILPNQLEGMIKDVDGENFFTSINNISRFYEAGDLDKIRRSQVESIENSMQASFFHGTPVEKIKANVNAMRNEADIKGVLIPSEVDNAIFNKLEDLQAQQDKKVKALQNAEEEKFAANVTLDTTGKISYKFTPEDVLNSHLKTEQKTKLLKEMGGQKNVKLPSVEEQKISENVLLGKFYAGQLTDQDIADLTSKQVAVETMVLDPDRYRTFMNLVKTKEAGFQEKEKVGVVRDMINQRVLQGWYSDDLKTKSGGEVYKKSQISEDAWMRAGKDQQALSQWMQDNPNGDPYKWYQDRLAQTLDTRVDPNNLVYGPEFLSAILPDRAGVQKLTGEMTNGVQWQRQEERQQGGQEVLNVPEGLQQRLSSNPQEQAAFNNLSEEGKKKVIANFMSAQ